MTDRSDGAGLSRIQTFHPQSNRSSAGSNGGTTTFRIVIRPAARCRTPAAERTGYPIPVVRSGVATERVEMTARPAPGPPIKGAGNPGQVPDFLTRQGNDPMPNRIFAIGDIHGCSTALRTLIEAIESQPRDTVVVFGDLIAWGSPSYLPGA